MFFVSAAHAEIRKVTGFGNFSNYAQECTGLSVGSVFDTSSMTCGVGSPINGGAASVCRIDIVSGSIRIWFNAACSSYAVIYTTIPTCTPPDVLNTSTGACEPPKESCEDLKATDAPSIGTVPNDGLAITASRIYCVTSNMCEAVSSYRASGGSLVRDTYYTGNECVGDAEDYADDPYYPNQNEPLPNGCVESGISATPYFCNEDSDGDGTPDETGNLDPYATCDYNSSGKFGCSGGSFSGVGDSSGSVSNPSVEATEQESVDELPDAVVPASGEVVEAVVNLNNDVNKSISALNKDLNKSNAQIEDQLKLLNSSSEGIKSQIVQSEQTAINIGNQTLNALNNNTNAVNGVSSAVGSVNNSVNSVKDAVEGLSGDIVAKGNDIVSAIGESSQGILDAMSDEFDQVTGGLDDINTSLDGLLNTGVEYTAEGHDFNGDEAFLEYLTEIQKGYESKVSRLEELVKNPPNILGSGEFSNGQYSGDSFRIRNQNIGFNLFGILGNNVSLIYSVVIFLATIIAVMIVLGSVSGGRKD